MSVLPIVDRELRVAARRAGTYWMRAGAAAVMVILWTLILANMPVPRALGGHYLLMSLGIPALLICMLAGVFLTSDSLSEEKREGTLGLLFLTDLKGYDVVLGKLVAHSLHAFFGLLAVLPILGLTLLMGGVTGWEFARMSLVFVATLFFSLSLGLAVSAVCREARQAIGAACFLVIVFVGLSPALWWLQHWLINVGALDFLLWPCRVFAYLKGFDSGYRFSGGWQFWASVGTSTTLGMGAMVLANVVLPSSWQEKSRLPAAKKSAKPLRAISGPKLVWMDVWQQYDPAFWLALRNPSARRGTRRILLLLLPIWLCGLLISRVTRHPEAGFVLALFTAFAMHAFIKLLVAVEASRRMNEDRRNGAWELLLVTTLPVESILAGQKKALREHFKGAVWLLLLVNFIMLGWVCSYHQQLHMGSNDLLIFVMIFLVGAAALPIDFHALSWVGMWRGLRVRDHHRAVVATLGQIMGVPWLLVFLLFAIRPAVTRGGAVSFVLFWFTLIVMLDFVSGRLARRRLKEEFRATVLLKQ